LVRATDLPDYEREHLLGKNLPPLGPHYWTKHAKPLNEMRVALITTAGIHFHDDESFEFADASFRPIPSEEDSSNLIMSHSSANFDRIGFVEDVNLVFPIDRFKELANAGTIGSLASLHYSFMGAGLMPEAYEKTTDQAARLLKQDQVDAVFLTPV